MLICTAVLFFQGAALAFGQGNITLSLHAVPISKVFNQLEAITGYHFVYSNKVLDDKRIVSIESRDWTLDQVMSGLLKTTGLSYRKEGASVVIVRQQRLPDAVQKLIKGRVTDTAGHPLSGVSVQILHTRTGMMTDMDGRFELQARAGDTLVLSYIGYEIRQVMVGDRQQIDVRLVPMGSQLNDIVVVGYGTQQKKFVTGSVASEYLQIHSFTVFA
jgi:hypothetical protein